MSFDLEHGSLGGSRGGGRRRGRRRWHNCSSCGVPARAELAVLVFARAQKRCQRPCNGTKLWRWASPMSTRRAAGFLALFGEYSFVVHKKLVKESEGHI